MIGSETRGLPPWRAANGRRGPRRKSPAALHLLRQPLERKHIRLLVQFAGEALENRCIPATARQSCGIYRRLSKPSRYPNCEQRESGSRLHRPHLPRSQTSKIIFIPPISHILSKLPANSPLRPHPPAPPLLYLEPRKATCAHTQQPTEKVKHAKHHHLHHSPFGFEFSNPPNPTPTHRLLGFVA